MSRFQKVIFGVKGGGFGIVLSSSVPSSTIDNAVDVTNLGVIPRRPGCVRILVRPSRRTRRARQVAGNGTPSSPSKSLGRLLN
mmetsp:Transcript_6127/g.13418  ORF Transcript_6127/g.13418 Transcript_6127/m.13418 type:complete len:83 (-) Transcript_6127:315-563(-)